MFISGPAYSLRALVISRLRKQGPDCTAVQSEHRLQFQSLQHQDFVEKKKQKNSRLVWSIRQFTFHTSYRAFVVFSPKAH